MRNIIKAFILSSIVLLVACSKSQGYDNIEELYKESLIALKSKDKAKIENFVTKLFPDNSSASYMKENNCVYRGYPKGLEKYPYATDSAIVRYTERLYKYALSLEARGCLNDLEFIGFDRNPDPEILNERNCKCEDVLFTEPYGLFVSKNDTIQYKLGELLKVDGKWKSFTDFKLN